MTIYTAAFAIMLSLTGTMTSTASATDYKHEFDLITSQINKPKIKQWAIKNKELIHEKLNAAALHKTRYYTLYKKGKASINVIKETVKHD
jgi:hypothetical protein